MKVEKILVPVDFSVCSFLLTEKVSSFSRALGAEVHFLHAMEVPAGLKPDTIIHPESSTQGMKLVDYLTQEAESYMKRYMTMSREAGVEAFFHLQEGPIIDTILQVAKSLRADLIMMGTHGRQGMTRMMLGSVAEEVIRQAEIPVMTIRSLHQPTCEAMSCATCTSGFTRAERQIRTEVDG